MKRIIPFALLFLAMGAMADETKKILCESLKEKAEIFDRYGYDMRVYASQINDSIGGERGTDVFERIQFIAQCKEEELDLDLSVKYAAYANVMYFRSADDVEESIKFYQEKYPILLNHIANYSLLSQQEKEQLLSIKTELPLFINSLKKLAKEFGSFDYSATIKYPTGSIQERNSNNKIIIDCREQIEGNCHELWYVLEKDQKRSVLNRLVLSENKIYKKLMKYDRDYFRATESCATLIYAAVASELIPFAPIILPIAVPGIIISGTVEGLRYVLVRKNHTIAYRSTIKNKDKTIGKQRFLKMIKYLKDIQFHPFKSILSEEEL